MSITINNLYKSYRNKLILKNINYIFKDGEKYIIEGENGTGKSTLLKCLLSLCDYKGRIDIDGTISYCPEWPIFPEFIKITTFLNNLLLINNNDLDVNEKIEEMLNYFLIGQYKNKELIKVSNGQKRKVNFIQAYLKRSDILLLDEPFASIDELSKKKIIDLLKNDPRLIIVITHEKEEELYSISHILKLKDGALYEAS